MGKAIVAKFTLLLQESGAQLAIRKHFFEPSFEIYNGVDTFVLVVNPKPTKLMFIDVLKIEDNSFKKMTIDFTEEGKIRDYDDYVLEGNRLAVNINDCITLWRINFEKNEPPEKTSHKMHDVRMCNMLVTQDYAGQACIIISQD